MNAPQPSLRYRLTDTLMNLISGLGTTKDKTFHASYVLKTLTREELNAAFRSDWIARKVVVAPADDSTREWRSWQAEDKQIEAIEKLESDLNVQQTVNRAMKMARLYGGSLILLGIDGAGNPNQELNLERVGKDSLKFIHAVARHDIHVTDVNRNLLEGNYGLPTMYTRSNDALLNQIHPSRVIRICGNELLDETDVVSNQGWGDPVLQAVDDAVRAAGIVSGGIASLVHEAKMDVIKIPQLANNLSTQAYSDQLARRFTYANTLKSTINTLLLDKEEEWNRIETSFAQLPEVLQMYLLIAAGASDIPATRLLGQSPKGMDATGESDIRNYYDRLASDQENHLSPTLNPLDEVLIRSATGSRDENIHYLWNPLWQMTDKEKAEIAKGKAEVMTADVAAGLIPIPALAEARKNQLIEDGTYPGIEAALEEFGEEETKAELGMQQAQKLLAAPLPGEGEPPGGAPDEDDEDEGPPTRDAWDPNKHPRHAAGTAKGGKFAPNAAHEALASKHGAAVAKEGHVYAYPTPEHGRTRSVNNEAKPHTEVVLYSGTKNPKEFGTIRSRVVSAATKGQGGPTIAASRHESLEFELNTTEGRSLHNNFKSAMRRAEEMRMNRKLRNQDEAIDDAVTPRTLYVRRDVKNGAEILRWAREQGIENLLPKDELHVTIAYSRERVDWTKVGSDPMFSNPNDDGTMRIAPGGMRMMERFGPSGDVLVLLFSSSTLSWRHESIRQAGASWDWDEYQPHVTIATDLPPELNIGEIEPYRGAIEFGPEIFEEINQNDGSQSVTPFSDGYNPHQPRVPKGHTEGGQFTSTGMGTASVPNDKKSKTKEELHKQFSISANEDDKDDLAEFWDQNIPYSPEEFQRRMLGDKLKPEDKMSVNFDNYSQVMSVGVALEGGGQLERNFDFHNMEVDHHFFKVPKELQGTGAAKSALASQVEMYKQLGMERVKTVADIDVGSYAWAKYGFVPDELDNALDGVRSRANSLLKAGSLSINEFDGVNKILKNASEQGDYKFMWKIADGNYGKALLFDNEWSAELNLNDREQMARFNQYVKKT